MPFSLGFWANQFAPAGAGTYELISTAYGTGASGTITFSSIPQTYKHLQLRWVSKSDSTGASRDVKLNFNGVSSTVYATHTLRGSGSSVFSTATTSTNNITLSSANEISTSTGFAACILDILDYASIVKNKTVRALYGSPDIVEIDLRSGLYAETTAVSSLTLAITGNFITASRFSLYGIRG